MSYTQKTPPLNYATADLPTDLEEGSVVFDTDAQELVGYRNNVWESLGSGAGDLVRFSATYVTDNVTGIADQIQGDIPVNWKKLNTSIKGLVIGTSCTSIGNYAFATCSNLTGSLTIPDSVTSIGSQAFFYCTSFNGSLTIGNSVTSIGNYAFRNCTGFNGSLTIPDSVTSIGSVAFDSCTGFNGSLTIGNSVTSIGGYAFYDCGFTGSLTIPDSVTSIGDSAFVNCNSITSVNILATTAPTIGSLAFSNMTSVSPAEIHVPIGATGYAASYDGLTVVYDL